MVAKIGFSQVAKLELKVHVLFLHLSKMQNYINWILTEYLRCIFVQAPYCQTEKDFQKLFPWNIKITEFHEEGTWKNDT